MIDYILKGGVVMIPILIASVAALTLIIEKFATLARLKKIPSAFLAAVFDAIGRNKLETAQLNCQNSRHPLARVFEAGLAELSKEVNELRSVEEAIKLKGDQILQRTETGLKILGSLVTVLPLLGFMGTIVGLIICFQKWEALGPAVTIGELSGGMYQAMITTAAGLILAIPYYLFHSYLTAKLESVEIEWSQYATEFLSRLRQAALRNESNSESALLGTYRERMKLAR